MSFNCFIYSIYH